MNKLLLLFFIGLSPFLYGQTPGNGVTDIDGNSYSTVIIGSQEWMAQNLKVSHYTNGDSIANEQDPILWDELSTGAWTYYNNDSSNDSIYGKLYNWYAVDDSRQLCPEGWFMPSDEDWDSLVDFLGGTWEAGAKLKEAGTIHWNAPNDGATDEYGFAALPGGSRIDGIFDNINDYGYYWSTWSDHPTSRHRWEMRYTQTLLAPFAVGINDGYNCRCLRPAAALGINTINSTSIISTYPNPVKNELNISIVEGELGGDYLITDELGRILVKGKLTSTENRLDLSELNPGLYLFIYKNSSSVIIKK